MIVVLCARTGTKLVKVERDVPAKLMLCESHTNRVFPVFPTDEEWFNSSAFQPDVPLSQGSKQLSILLDKRSTDANTANIRATPATEGGASSAPAPTRAEGINATAPNMSDGASAAPIRNGESIYQAQVEVEGDGEFADTSGDESEITTASAWATSLIDDETTDSPGPPGFTPPELRAISAYNHAAAKPLKAISAARKRRIVTSDDSQTETPSAPPGKQAGAKDGV